MSGSLVTKGFSEHDSTLTRASDRHEELPEFDNVPPDKPTVSRLRNPHSRDEPCLVIPVEGSGAPPPTPIEYEFLLDTCDLYFACEGFTAADREATAQNTKSKSMSERIYSVKSSKPSIHVNPPSYVIDLGNGVLTRKTWGLPML